MTPENTPVAPAADAPAAAPAAPAAATEPEPTTEPAQQSHTEEHALPPSEVPPEATSPPPPASRPLQDSLQAIKLGGQRLAAMLKQRRESNKAPDDPAAAAAAAAAPGAAAAGAPPPAAAGGVEGPSTVDKIKATAAELGLLAKQQGSRFYSASAKTAAAAAEGIKRLTLDDPVQALCRGELGAHPVPQVVLATTNALVAGGGLTAQRIFKHEAPAELVDALMPSAEAPMRLIPPGTSPHALAGLLKQFLLGLPEPLLTYRLLPEFVAAADHLDTTAVLVRGLPPANANTLRLLLQLCALINKEAAVNEMDAQALAEVLLPCLAWKPAPKAAAAAAAGGTGPWQGLGRALSKKEPAEAGAAAAAAMDVPPAAAAAEEGEGGGEAAVAAAAGQEGHRIAHLEGAEAEALVLVLEHMITHYDQVFP